MHEQPLDVYIGYDSEMGKDAARVCEYSLRINASQPLRITLLDQEWLRRIGLYRRTFYVRDGQCYDTLDGLPFSTQFSYSRFLVPSLQPSGWAIFVDGDFLFRDDVYELAALFNPRYAVMCVKHEYDPAPGRKMMGQVQSPYPRKNWSSLMAFNCSNSHTRALTPYQVNTMTGARLHQLAWVPDEAIGELPEEWNWLDGHSDQNIDPSAVHFTRGTPDMPGWEATLYAELWRETKDLIDGDHKL